jgi:uracil phosphoribosyltransferase
MVFNLSGKNSLANQFLLELRDSQVQKDRMRFRKNMERLGEIMAFEVSKQLQYVEKVIETPLGRINTHVLQRQPVLITVLRAGIPYFQGFLNFFDKADSGFIGAYRKEDDTEITIELDYVATPLLEGREIIIVDPMLATGKSFVKTVNAILPHGKPAHIYLASVVAVPEGLKFVQENLDLPFSIWTCAVDEYLNEQFYIVPGLGDAGDLSYGVKL